MFLGLAISLKNTDKDMFKTFSTRILLFELNKYQMRFNYFIVI